MLTTPFYLFPYYHISSYTVTYEQPLFLQLQYSMASARSALKTVIAFKQSALMPTKSNKLTLKALHHSFQHVTCTWRKNCEKIFTFPLITIHQMCTPDFYYGPNKNSVSFYFISVQLSALSPENKLFKSLTSSFIMIYSKSRDILRLGSFIQSAQFGMGYNKFGTLRCCFVFNYRAHILLLAPVGPPDISLLVQG